MKKLTFAFLFSCLVAVPSRAGSIFLTGHDPDFHADLGLFNQTGAIHINQIAISFILDPAFNPFADKFIFVESNITVPDGHTNGVQGIIDSGFIPGVDFDRHTAATLNAALNGLGTTYGGIVVASDFGGILTQAELDILNARSLDIISFLNAGGGLYAMAESGGGAGLTSHGRFGYLPFVVSSLQVDDFEDGYTLTPFGASLGLTVGDINGNFTHNIFIGTGHPDLQVVDRDRNGNIVSLAGRIQIGVPEPSSLLLLCAGAALLALRGRGRL